MKGLRNAWPYALLGGVALAATWPILRAAGMPYNVDISGFFPLSPQAYEGRFWPLWNERGGISTAQFLPALAFELPLLLAGRVLGWGMDVHIKIRMVLGFALAGMAMYALARHYVLRLRPHAPAAVLVLAPLAAGLLYMLNPWSVHRAFQYFLWIGYGMAPLVVLAFERLSESPTWKRALAFAAVTALATTDPHNPFTFAILLAPLALVRLAPLVRRDREAARRLVGAVAFSATAYVAFGAYWILPYIQNALHNPSFGPTYVLSQQMLDTLSRDGSFVDALRLLNNYLPRGDLLPAGGLALQAWTVASFAVPLLAFAAVAIDRSRVAWTYAALAVAMVVLGMGSRGPVPGGYAWLLFRAPWGEGLSWIFRDPYRWGGLLALAYGVLIALSLAGLGAMLGRVRIPTAAPVVGLACCLVFAGPALASYTHGAYEPVVVPSEYAEANAYLAAAPADAGVVWMPRTLGDTTWSGDRTVEYFDATSSGAPALGPFRPHTSTYFDFLGDAIKDGAPVAPLLARAGADRILYHNDVDPETGARTIRQIESLGLVDAGSFGSSPTLRVDQSSAAPTYTPAARFALYADRELEQTFVPNATIFSILSLRASVVGAPGPLRVAIADATGHEVFARNVTLRPSDVNDDVALDGLRLLPGATYTLRLRASEPSNATSRYDLSYYLVDTYPRGALAGMDGDLHFELFAREAGFATALVSPDPAPRARLDPVAVASPDGLQLLRALEALPANASLREAPVLFLDQAPAARAAFAQGGNWSWVGGFEDGSVAAVVPFLPKDALRSPFAETTAADTSGGWARGTQDFTYYQWGWKPTLAAQGDESWEFDGGDGLAYATSPANISMPIHAEARSVLVARVYESPDGGPLAFRADGPAGSALVGRLTTRDDLTGFRWVEVGAVPEGATRLDLASGGGLQGIDLVAVVPQATYDLARNASLARLDAMPVTLVAQAETIPALANKTVALAGVGRVATLAAPVDLPLRLPASGDYSLWLRVPAGAALPNASLDGVALRAPACAADCGRAAVWLAVPLGRLDAGAHALRLGPAPGGIDVLAVSSDPGFAGGRGASLAWTRASATEYRVHVPQGGLLALAVPYDAGWIARVDGAVVRSVPVDGVSNGFVLPRGGDVTITYEPQAWADAGVLVSLVAALSSLGLAGAAAWRRRAAEPATEVFP